MNRFSFFLNPYPDELLLSYILRILRRNGIDLDVFEKYYVGDRLLKIDKLSFDAKQAFWAFYQSLSFDHEVDAGEFFLSLSTFPFQSIFMTRERQMNYINNVFRKVDKLNPLVRVPFKTISVCPVCVTEDNKQHGEPFLHRVHHLPGVCVCPKHHVLLHQYQDYNEQEAAFEYAPIESNIPEEDLIAYADYAQAIFSSGVRSDIKTVKEAIYVKFRLRKYLPSGSYKKFFDAIKNWKHCALLRPLHVLRYEGALDLWLSAIEGKAPQDILALLMFLYPEPQELIDQIATDRDLICKYTCPNCGNVFYTNPLAQETGFGCPQCDEKLSDTERYSHIVQVLGQGEYELKEPYVSNSRQTRMFHRRCGQEFTIKPGRFIYYGGRCLCRIRYTEDEVREYVEVHGFQLLSYKNTTSPMILFHPKCGGTFQISPNLFRTNSFCRICEAPRAKH